MGISRFGKRYDEKLKSAMQRAIDEEERLRNMTPAEKVSEAAANFELLEQTGEVLSKALVKALKEVHRQKSAITKQGSGGWMETTTTNTANVTGVNWTQGVHFKAVYDMPCDGYRLEASGSLTGPRKYFIGEESLNRHSATTVTFQEWIMKVARALYVLLRDGSDIAGNAPLSQVVREAMEQLEFAGVQMVTADGYLTSRSEAEELDEAIASIKRTLDEHPET